MPQGGKLSLLLALPLHVGRGVQNFKQIFTQAGPGPRSVQDDHQVAIGCGCGCDHYVFTAAIFGATFMQNKQPATCLHPSILHRRRQAVRRGELARGVSCVSFVMLCRAAIDLEQTTQHISSHVPERTQQRLLASPFSSLCPSSSAGNMICISSPVPSPASSASLDLICMRALACLTLSCCQPCFGSVSYFTFISAASSSPPPSFSSTASLLCFCLFMSCPSGGFTSNCCVGNAKRKVRIGPISLISSPSLSLSLPPCSSHFCGFCAASVLRRVCVF